MPVVVEKRRANLRLANAVPQVSSGAGAWASLAGQAASVSSQMGRMLGALAEDEAVALASRVRLDDNYEPIMPEGRGREKFGIAARAAFDKSILPRQAQALETDLADIVAGVRDRHQFDPDGFAVEIAEVAGQLEDDIPQELHGQMQTILGGLVQRTASRIGWNTAQEDRRNENERFRVNAGRLADDVWLKAQAGELDTDEEIAQFRAVADDLLERKIIGPSEYDAAMRELGAARGAGSILGTIESESWTAEQVRDVQDKLIRGSDPEMNSLFESDRDRMRAASRLGQVASRLEGDAREAEALQSEAFETRNLMMGAADNTKANRERFDQVLGQTAGLAGPVRPEHWLQGRLNTAEVWDQIRVSGVLPESLRGAFRMYANGSLSEDGQVQVYRMWQALSNGTTPDGSPAHLSGLIPEQAVETLQLVESLMPVHGISGAYERARVIRAEGIDREIVANRLTDHLGEEVSSENVNARITNMVRTQMRDEENIALGERQLADASRQMRTMIGAGVDAGDAWDMVKRTATSRLVETDFIYDMAAGVVSRHEMAPELYYSVPKERLFGLFKTDSVSWFEGWAEKQIRQRVAGVELPDAPLTHGEGGLYNLVPDMRTTGRPSYRVMIDPDGNGIYDLARDADGGPLILSPHSDWLEAMEPTQEEQRRQLERARGAGSDSGPEAGNFGVNP